MVYIQEWESFFEAVCKLQEKNPTKTRYLIKFRAKDSSLVLKVTDDVVCIKYKTSKASDLKHMETLNSHAHSHVPYPVILIKASQKWIERHSKPPSNRAEEQEFKVLIRSMQHNDEQNFEEAINRAYMAYTKYSIPDEIQTILNDERADQLVDDHFWILVNAVKQFSYNEGKGKLPLIGAVPDMHSETLTFVTIQELYHQKANYDFEAVKRYTKQNLERLGKHTDEINDATIKLFCKNCLLLRVLKYRSLEEEITNPRIDNLEMNMIDFMTMEQGNGIWYILLRAAEKFYAQHNRYPGEIKEYAEDYYDLKKHTDAYLKEIKMESDRVSDEHIFELCRFGNAQLHTIGAFIGGVAAQETIKLITKKWAPMNNTFIYNGIKSSSATFEI